jgi:outer membrane protein OmpA-like peptidoglycan-associated protein
MRATRTASAHAPTLAILATVALSVILFFVFTLPNSKKGKGDPKLPADDPNREVVAPAPPPEPVPPIAPVEPPAEPDFTASPDALVGQVAKLIAAGDLDALKELLGSDAKSAAALEAAFGHSGYAPAAGQKPVEVGSFGGANRWAIPVQKRFVVLEPKPEPNVLRGEESITELNVDALTPAPIPEVAPDPEPPIGLPAAGDPGPEGEAGAGGDAGIERLYLDLVPNRQPDGTIKWGIKEIHFPPAIQDLVDAADPTAAAARSEQDAMAMADKFITAVTGRDFITALRVCSSEGVPEEKIAGLCIVFEEGQFTLRKNKPLIATALGDAKSWVIAHVESPKLDEGSEFGLIMGRDPEGAWQITEINFGKLLDTYVDASEAGTVPYTPIKSQPGTGDLLVLYFEYDGYALLPRAKRQLEILSGILKADPGKQLTIAGHADALGSEDYNARLSATRAASVAEQLIAFGVPDTQVRTTGFGEAKPWKPNERPDGTDDPKGRAYNRRAELYLDFSQR